VRRFTESRPILDQFKLDWTDTPEILGLLPFKQFHAWMPDISLYTLYSLKFIDGEYEICFVNYTDSSMNAPIATQVISTITVIPTKNKLGVDLHLKSFSVNGENFLSSLSGEGRSDYTKAAYRNMEYILSFFKYTQSNDMYMVERSNRRSARDARSKKPWTRNDLPSIVYLNQLPSERKEHQGGTHESPRSHQRRGHWRNMVHERFKNHPKFGQKIRIKPSWVGDTKAVVNGVIYKLKETPSHLTS